MNALFCKIFSSKVRGTEYLQILLPEGSEGIQQLRKGFAMAIPDLGKAIKGLESFIRSIGKDDMHAGYPIGFFPMDQVSDNIIRAPGIRPFVLTYPFFGKTLEHIGNDRGCPFQYFYRFIQVEGYHDVEFLQINENCNILKKYYRYFCPGYLEK